MKHISSPKKRLVTRTSKEVKINIIKPGMNRFSIGQNNLPANKNQKKRATENEPKKRNQNNNIMN